MVDDVAILQQFYHLVLDALLEKASQQQIKLVESHLKQDTPRTLPRAKCQVVIGHLELSGKTVVE